MRIYRQSLYIKIVLEVKLDRGDECGKNIASERAN